jgi:hypothetical protein
MVHSECEEESKSTVLFVHNQKNENMQVFHATSTNFAKCLWEQNILFE